MCLLRSEFTWMTPLEAMRAGREKHKSSDMSDWLHKRVEVMNTILFEKFKNPELRRMLLSTSDKYIEETNWWGDTYWGVCNGVGENMLGKIIMNLREYLRNLEKMKYE